ncbi:hypothetical protein SAMN05877838_0987 [Hoeflea halophila]|uniref:Uncharacterized protein n=1 Tax=Hoeflea halophila TaxID=714899 RepID=A0A286I2Q9_9HYPH|nr:hypothetical protein [Hoeflea halophila]SOE14341.1 hypothetical protein SAMN05877838_0987 [Hoeflea halophila]
METGLATRHFAAAGVIFALLGALAHVCRAVFNVFPDKLSDTPAVNIMVSSDYGWADYFWGTVFDDAGYYRLDSGKNLRLSVIFTVLGGLAAMLFVEGAGLGFAQLIETGAGAFAELFWQRVAEL